MQGCQFVVRYSPTGTVSYRISTWSWPGLIVRIQGRLLSTLQTFVYGFSSLLSRAVTCCP